MSRLGSRRWIRDRWMCAGALALFLVRLLAPIHILHSRISKIVHVCAWISLLIDSLDDGLNGEVGPATLLSSLLRLAVAPESSHANVELDGPQWVLVRAA